jgi:hypothetical protein
MLCTGFLHKLCFLVVGGTCLMRWPQWPLNNSCSYLWILLIFCGQLYFCVHVHPFHLLYHWLLFLRGNASKISLLYILLVEGCLNLCIYFAVLRVEFKTLHLLGKRSTTWPTLPTLFLLVIFEMGSGFMPGLGRPPSSYLCFLAQTTGVTGVCYCI